MTTLKSWMSRDSQRSSPRSATGDSRSWARRNATVRSSRRRCGLWRILPRGWQDEQAPGQYRLRQRQDGALFGFAAPALSGKSVLFPADELLWRSRVTGDGPHIARAVDDAGPYAFVGLRSCDLRAIQTQDRVLLGRAVIDVHYQARRADTFVVAVGCSDPAGTCFCVSMGSGPAPDSGHDLALTELYADPDEHRFVVQAGSQRGADLLADLPTRPATPADLEAAAAVHSGAVARMGRQVETKGLKDLVYDSVESPRWDDVAARCLACTNCTLVCPTCFCTSIEDTPAWLVSTPNGTGCGTPAFPSPTPTSTAAASGPPPGPGIGSGSPTNSPRGRTSSTCRVASVAAGASPGARPPSI